MRPVRRIPHLMPTYTGEAPQEKLAYICEQSVRGECQNDACGELHFTSAFLWQVNVRGRWCNLDTVNDEIERACDNQQPDYLTQVFILHYDGITLLKYYILHYDLTQVLYITL